MKVLVRPRQCGKTTELLKLANDRRYVIITFNQNNVKNLKYRAKELGYDNIDDIVTFKDAMGCGLKSKTMNGIVIDNVDMVLADLLGNIMPSCMGNLAMVTMTGIPEQDYDEYDDVMDWQDFQKNHPNVSYRDFVRLRYELEYD